MAYISYFEERNLVFASGAGVRIHGSVFTRRREDIPPGFRLYFRDAYGVDRVEPGSLYDFKSKPIKHLVATSDKHRHAPFINSVAYEISKRIGAQVPECKPAMLFLNGELQGAYSLVERLHKRQWEYHFGHDNFVFYRYRSKMDKKSAKLHDELKSWAMDFSKKMTWEEAEKRVNLESLSRHIIFIAFCGNTDWSQGAAVLDLSKPNANWSWISWDLDDCILDRRSLLKWVNPPRQPWEQESFELVLSSKLWSLGERTLGLPIKRRYVRAILFSRLIKESPEYRDYFIRLTMDILNHRLTASYYVPLINNYKKMAISYGFRDETHTWIRKFFRNRPNIIRAHMTYFFSEGDCLECEVRGPGGINYEIDGYPESAGYRGMYFKRKKITVKILDQTRDIFSHWIVNGEKVETPCLEHEVLTKTYIEPVFYPHS